GITGHQGFDAVEVVGVYCMLKLPDLFERLNMRFKLGPTGKAVQTRNLELSFGNRAGIADLEQVFGLQLEMAEIGTVRKRTWTSEDSAGTATSFRCYRPRSASRAERRLAKIFISRWASALSADRLRP